MLVGRFSKLEVLAFASEPLRAAPPRNPFFLSLCSPTDLAREKRFFIHPLTFEVGDVGESPGFCCPVSVSSTSV